MSDFWDAMDAYQAVKPAERGDGGSGRPKIGDLLPEGDYEFEVVDVTSKMAGKDPAKPLFVLGLRVMAPIQFAGQVGELQYWLTDENSVSRCFRDLVTLGMDPAVPFKDGLKVFVGKLPGRKFKGKRQNGSSNGKTYNNCYINSLTGSGVLTQPPVMSSPPASHDSVDVPF